MSTEQPQTPFTVPPQSTTPPPPKKGNAGRTILLGSVGALLLACGVIGGIIWYQGQQQEANYNTGHAAYLKADCKTALEPLTKAANGDPGDKDSDVAKKAMAELQECEALLAAGEQASAGKAADALVDYANFALKYDKSPLIAAATTASQELLAGDPAKVASTAVCNGIDQLIDLKFIANAAETMPPLLFACGQAYEAEKQFAEAVVMYDRFRSDYANHSLAPEVEKALVRASLADADVSGAGSLPPPQAVGNSEGGQVEVVIQNDSPNGLQIIFSGPETRVEEVEPCADCVKFTGNGPDACPEKGPVARYTLTPGSYDVVVKSSDSSQGSVTPFRGTWDLEGGQEYNSCFYIVTRSN